VHDEHGSWGWRAPGRGVTVGRMATALSPKSIVRRLLARRGYWSTHRSVLPMGVDPIWDMQRLSERFGIEVRTVFDVGAHIGLMTRSFLDGFPNAKVHAFEPHPNSFACLARVEGDRLQPHRLALSDASGEGQFFVYGELHARLPPSLPR
jgi:hypothetical protein